MVQLDLYLLQIKSDRIKGPHRQKNDTVTLPEKIIKFLFATYLIAIGYPQHFSLSLQITRYQLDILPTQRKL